MKANLIVLILATVCTGLMAGLFFNWSNTIKPGIGRLSAITYLESFKALNKVILNPTFFLVFFGSIVLIPLATFLNYKSQDAHFTKLLIGAFGIYFIGMFLVTLFGNIPLNNLLENTNLKEITSEEATNLRGIIEKKWNNLNMVRTIASLVSFVLLVLALVKVKNGT